jgi:hypothetical protein
VYVLHTLYGGSSSRSSRSNRSFLFYYVAGVGRESHVIGGNSQSPIERRRPVGIEMDTVGYIRRLLNRSRDAVI